MGKGIGGALNEGSGSYNIDDDSVAAERALIRSDP